MNFWHLTTNMVDSVQQNFCEKILIPSDFICMFKMSFFFLAHPVNIITIRVKQSDLLVNHH